ncbi:MAG: translation initiation factor IF-3 [Eubacteriales bacterium]|nr:translation initiation factor IF-3 [Eubacteriales bacterium]MDD3867277.1 translation initiation factor IF-3 [Eubacteriales bacterium]
MFIAKQNKGHITNDSIRYPRVRLIDSEGNMVGVVETSQARQMAENLSLDLVVIAPQAEVPVCRIMDYGKFLFEQSKKERDAKKKQKVTEVKEVGVKLTTEEHDFGYKTRNACRFLEDGDRVKVVIRFRGREMAYTHRGFDVMKQFADACSEFGTVDRPPRVEGRNMVMFMAPNKE